MELERVYESQPMTRSEAQSLLPGLYEIRKDLWVEGNEETVLNLSYEVRGALEWTRKRWPNDRA